MGAGKSSRYLFSHLIFHDLRGWNRLHVKPITGSGNVRSMFVDVRISYKFCIRKTVFKWPHPIPYVIKGLVALVMQAINTAGASTPVSFCHTSMKQLVALYVLLNGMLVHWKVNPNILLRFSLMIGHCSFILLSKNRQSGSLSKEILHGGRDKS